MFGKIMTTALLAIAASAQTSYTIDGSHSSAQFSVRHLMISNVKGEFRDVKGTVVYDPNNLPASRIEATIAVDSIYTGEPKRDAHLKTADFFDAAKYPLIGFRSERLWKSGGKVFAKGALSMHGVTREVTLEIEGPTAEVKDPWGNLRFGASAKTKINRKDWGLAWNQALETGGVMVGEEVTITLEIEAVRPAAKTAAPPSAQ